jgi:hypothetical protein
MLRHAAFQIPRNGTIGANSTVFAGFLSVAGASTPDPEPPTLAIRNLTGCSAERILQP